MIEGTAVATMFMSKAPRKIANPIPAKAITRRHDTDVCVFSFFERDDPVVEDAGVEAFSVVVVCAIVQGL